MKREGFALAGVQLLTNISVTTRPSFGNLMYRTKCSFFTKDYIEVVNWSGPGILEAVSLT